jgi:four helix bundle protein
MKIRNYKDLIVWQKSFKLVKLAYRITHNFPKSETYGLASQIRRAAVSIPSNIAEGQGRNHRQEFSQFLGIAYGSVLELETELLIAKDLYPLNLYEEALTLLEEVRRMLVALLKTIKSSHL